MTRISAEPNATLTARCSPHPNPKENAMTTPVHLDDNDRAVWQMDVDECDECQALDDETVCADHDLDDDTVAARYSGSGGD